MQHVEMRKIGNAYRMFHIESGEPIENFFIVSWKPIGQREHNQHRNAVVNADIAYMGPVVGMSYHMHKNK